MKLNSILFAAISICISIEICGCDSSNEPAHTTNIERPAFKRIMLTTRQSDEIGLNNQFAFDLFKQINANPAHAASNKVFSPISMYMLLSMLANADDSETSQEILAALTGNPDLTGMQQLNDFNAFLLQELPEVDPTASLSIRNALWFNRNYSCNVGFKSVFSDVYSGAFFESDFSDKSGLINRINSWVEESTSGMVKKFLNDNANNDKMYLVNTSYFKGIWQEKFPIEKSDKSYFHTPDGKKKVTMMHIKESFSYYEDEKAQIVELPYGSGNFVMDIILPNENTDISAFALSFDMGSFNKYEAGMKTFEVDLSIPKFSVESRIKFMDSDFTETGIRSIFNTGLAKLCDGTVIPIESFLTQTCIKVDEQGTEAAAASTFLEYTSNSPYLNSAEMTVDRPFIFIIKEISTNAILYMGRIEQF